MYKNFILKLCFSLAFTWIVCLSCLSTNLQLLALGLVAFSLGLRHGFDADHIVAIDNITRKLQAEQKPFLSTGLFFALGHSTIVLLLTILIILGLHMFDNTFDTFKSLSSTIGTCVSVCFLWLTVLMNLQALFSLLDRKSHQHTLSHGILDYMAQNFFNKVDNPIKMYMVGFCFGLGFDTATEIGLLSIAAAASLNGVQVWLILLLPILFASGMILIDSLDCIFMSSLYNWVANDMDKLRKYNIVIIGFTTLLAFSIGLFELIGLLGTIWSWSTTITNISKFINLNSTLIGAGIIGWFICLWIYSKLSLNFRRTQIN
jgi:nickel/cobalt transporter (NiCoT) family protein